MNVKKIVSLVAATLAINGFFIADASAESIRLRCETRGTARSKISVDGRGFDNTKLYKAVVKSGNVTKVSKKPMKRPVRGQVGFDFDSNNADVRAGATKIDKTYIKGNKVAAMIVDQDGFKVTVPVAACRKR